MVKSSIRNFTQEEEGSRRTPGRPRSERARAAILTATLELLERDGFAELSIEGVATAAGASKATIYRWWPNKAALVADAFMSSAIRETRFCDTGSIRNDLREQMQRLASIFRGSRGRIIRSLIGGGQSDPELLEAFRNRWLLPRRREGYEILAKAIERGQLPADLDMDMFLDTLYGPLYFRMLAGHGANTSTFIDQLCDLIFNGVELRPARKNGSSRN